MDEVFPSQPDAILGTGREQLPGEYQSVFLPGDLILFQSPGSDAPLPPGNRISFSPSHVQDGIVFCDYCILDKIIRFTILASLCVLFILRLGLVMPGFLLVFMLAIGTLLLIASYLQPRLKGSKKYDHYHTTAYIVQKLLPTALYDHLDGKFEDFLAFIDIWRTIHVAGEKLPNQYRYTNPDLEFRPISFIAARLQLQEGWLVLRLQRYPDLFEWPRLA